MAKTLIHPVEPARRPDQANRISRVARRLDVAPRTVWRLIATGKLRADRIGPRCTRVFDSEIERFIAEQRSGRGA